MSDSESSGAAVSDVEYDEPQQVQAPAPKSKRGAKKNAKEKTPRGKKRKAKDAEDKPKRAKTAFMYFNQEFRPLIRQEHPEASFGEIGRLVADRWRAADDDEKERFNALAGEDKERYTAEMGKFKKPKKAMTAFMLFSQKLRPKVKEDHPDASFGEVGKILGALWRDLTKEEKEEYETMAKEEKVRYNVEVEKFNQKNAPPPAAHSSHHHAEDDDEEEEDEDEDD